MLTRDMIRTNRRHLHSVSPWIRDDDYRRSRGHYGCPPHLYPLLDRPIGDDVTYTDILTLAAARMGPPIRYLELGVSVGKNFFVLANVLDRAELVGFDLEPINPALEERLRPAGPRGALTRYTLGDNRIAYLGGDILSEDAWRLLGGPPFNLVLSDALHRPAALRHEAAMLRKLGLVDRRRFCIVWDDLDADPDGPMSRSFFEIARQLAGDLGAGDEGIFLAGANGWLGEHEHRHTIGIANNIGLTPASCAGPEARQKFHRGSACRE